MNYSIYIIFLFLHKFFYLFNIIFITTFIRFIAYYLSLQCYWAVWSFVERVTSAMKLWEGILLLFSLTCDICLQFLNHASFFLYILRAVEPAHFCWGVKQDVIPEIVALVINSWSQKVWKKRRRKNLPVHDLH